ncbi:MAG: tetratricopeptide repeat protein, partial [Gemmatimonadetes bacterium]|nr:tetratricopeptide repeat protein [Gemmatimonadota bacterium]
MFAPSCTAPRRTLSWSVLAALVWTAACDAGPPTFAADVAPLVYENCAACHRDGGPAPFTLLTYDDVAAEAEAIARATSRRYMPPWLPENTDVAFAGHRGLTDDQIALLSAWAEAGAPAGDLSRAPEAPAWPSGWALGEPDLVVTMDAPFDVPAGGGDLFHNFVIPVPIDGTRYVRGMELDPGNTAVVHHAVVSVDATPSSRAEDARTPGQGYPGMVSTSRALAAGGFFVGWTPGRIPTFNPPGLAWTLEPGTDLVVQLHLRPIDVEQTVQARVAFYFTDEPPAATPVVVRLGGQSIDIPPGEANYVVRDSLELPVAVDALAIYPHAHYIGKSMDVRAELPFDDGELHLLSIPEWDFNWQDAYSFAEAVELPAGTELRIHYTFDNSADNPANPFDPPRRVVYGRHSSDEMAELHLQVIPREPDQLETLRRTLALKAERAQVEGWRHMLSLDPEDAEAHFGLGTLAQRDGDLAEAERRYLRAVTRRPDFAQAQYNLGLVREELGRAQGALQAYRAAVVAFPAYVPAQNNLGALLASRGEPEAAEVAFRAILDVDPEQPDALNNLGNVLRAQDRLDEALDAYRGAQAARPGFELAEINAATTLLALGRVDEAAAALGAAAGGDVAATAEARVLMAWALATDPDPDRRRPTLAVGLVEDVARLTANGDPFVLDVLAAAYAGEGDFPPAIGAAQQALTVARASGDTALAEGLAARIALYQA